MNAGARAVGIRYPRGSNAILDTIGTIARIKDGGRAFKTRSVNPCYRNEFLTLIRRARGVLRPGGTPRLLFACRRTAVTGNVVPVVALFAKATLFDAVATEFLLALSGAAVAILFISVIARFSRLQLPVTAGGFPFNPAYRRTSIAVGRVPIIALLDACLNKAVAAFGDHASIEAGIRIVLIPVIALLTGLCQTITAYSRFDNAAGAASISAYFIPIIALLAWI